MDWKAVACRLAQERPPGLLVDRSLRIQILDERLAVVLRLDPERAHGQELETFPALAPLRVLVTRAFRDKEVDGTCTVESATGDSVELVAQATRIGEGDDAIVHLSVGSAVVRGRVEHEASTTRGFSYDIRDDLTDFGRLHRFAMDGDDRHYWRSDSPRCHELLHACSTPCTDCPALPRDEVAPTAIRSRSSQFYEVVRAEPGPGRIRLVVHRVGRDDLAALQRAWLTAALTYARLTPAERAAVLRLQRLGSAWNDGATSDLGAGARKDIARAVGKLRASGLAKILWLLV